MLGVDFCSDAPYVVLAQYASRENGPRREIMAMLPWEASTPYFGVYPVGIGFDWPSGTSGTMDVLEPFEQPFAGVPDPSSHLRVRIEAHDDGWDLAVNVDLIDCGVWQCFCPCE